MVYHSKVICRVAVLLLLGILCLVLPAQQALADNPIVTITVSKWVVGLPSGLVLTYVSDTQVDIDWVKGTAALNSMVRVKDGSSPLDRDDGNLLYYGTEAHTSDKGVNFEEGTITRYYRVWSQAESGVWEEVGISGYMENPYMLLAVLVGLALAFTIGSAILKKGYLSFAGAGAWVITSIYCFSRYTVEWDTYFCLGFLFVALMLACAFSPLAWRETTPAGEPIEEDDMGMREEFENWDKDRSRYGYLYGNRSPRRRRPKNRWPKWAKTGRL